LTGSGVRENMLFMTEGQLYDDENAM